MNRAKHFYIILLSAFILISSQTTHAVSEENLIVSAKKIVQQWSGLLKKDHSTVSGEYDTWCVYRSALIGDLSYDIQKTNSIVSPYLLIITGKAQWGSNLDSPNADNPSEVFDNNQGFTTKEKALQNVKESDFIGDSVRYYDIRIYYTLREDVWTMKEPNRDFIDFMNEKTSSAIKELIPDLMTFKVNSQP